MYCNNCGKHNPEGSKFCQHCGKKFTEHYSATEGHSSVVPKSTHEFISQHTTPYPYVISLWKFFILSIVTFGLFDIYWFYRQWKSFYAVKNQKHGWFYIFFISLFAGFSSFSLFKIIAKEVKEVDQRRGLEATGLSIAYILLNILYKLPNPYWLLSSLSIFALLPVQRAINYYWEKKYDDKVVRSGFGVWNFIVAFIGIIVVILALYGTFGTDSSNTTSSTTQDNSTVNSDTSTNTYVSPSPATDTFKTNYQSSFAQSCEKGASGMTEVCNCMANYMITNYTDVQLTQITLQYKATGKTPQALTDAENSCTSSSISPSTSQ